MYFHAAMLRAATPFSHVASKQPQDTIWIPVPVGDPTSHEPDFAGEIGTRKSFLSAAKKFKNRLPQFRRNLLIGIQRQNPWLRRMPQRQIFLLAKSLPRMPENFRAERSGDGLRAILNFGIKDDDDFRRPFGDSGQTFPDAMRLGSGNDAD